MCEYRVGLIGFCNGKPSGAGQKRLKELFVYLFETYACLTIIVGDNSGFEEIIYSYIAKYRSFYYIPEVRVMLFVPRSYVGAKRKEYRYEKIIYADENLYLQSFVEYNEVIFCYCDKANEKMAEVIEKYSIKKAASDYLC